MYRPLLLLLFPILFLTTTAQAQQSQPDNYCATELSEDQKEWLARFQQEWYQSGETYTRSGTRFIPLKIHIVGTDEGFGYYRLDHLYTSICELNEKYAPVGFFFYIEGDIIYHDNTSWYDHDWFAGNQLMNQNENDGVNMYFVESPAGNCGYFSPFGDAVAMAKSCSAPGNSTIAHELGHFFNLPHTFDGWEDGEPNTNQQEKVDGSNCNFAGDGFCDTPPDYAPYRWNCPFTGPFTDPDGVEFYPDGTYYMSYSNDGCQDKFGDDQMAAMNNNLLTQRADLLSGTFPAQVTLGEVDPLTPAPDETDLAPNYTVLSWTEDPMATGYHVQIALNTAFTALIVDEYVTTPYYEATDLLTLKTYRWRVKPIAPANTCADYTLIQKFTTGEVLSGIEDSELVSGISTFPNPVSSSQTLTVAVDAKTNFEGIVSIFDINGKEMFAMNSQFVLGRNNVSIATETLSPGIYLAKVNAPNETIQQKFIVAE